MPDSILVPVNFSEVALHALGHAIELAELCNARIVCYHAIDVPARTGILMDVEGRLVEDIREEMEEWKQRVTERYDYSEDIDSRISAGDLFHMTRQLTNSFEDSLVVVGTEGAQGIKEFLGSTAMGVIRTSHVPVYVVPDTAPDFTMNHLLFGLSRQNVLEEDKLNILRLLLERFKPKLTVFTVRTSDEQTPLDQNLVKQVLYGYPFEWEEVKSEDPIEALDDRIDEGDIDLLCLIKVKRSFMERLFHSSRVRHEAFHCKIPMLVFRN